MSDKPPITDRPREIAIASWALVAEAGSAVLAGISVFLASDGIRDEIIASNERRNKASNGKLHLTLGAHDVHNLQVSVLVQSILVALVTVALAFPIRNGRAWAKWTAIVITAYLGISRFQSVTSSAPGIYKVATALTLVASVVAIVFLLLRPSNDFFTAHRRPSAREGGYGGFFSPKPRTGTRAATATPPVPVAPSTPKTDLTKRPSVKPGQVRPKSKSRNTGKR